jgi:hypothetical protein
MHKFKNVSWSFIYYDFGNEAYVSYFVYGKL